MKTLTHQTIKALRSELEAALSTLGKNHSMLFEVDHIRHGAKPCEISVKVSGSLLNENKEPSGREAEIYRRFAQSKGLRPEWLGKPVRFHGATWQILGMTGVTGRYVKVKRLRDGYLAYVTPKQITLEKNQEVP